jgi:uncharacterized protein YndB with AHSA1/START domain
MGAARSADDLIDDREYAAPRELVFECWTHAQHFARWFAPDAVEVPVCEIDARAGGVIRFVHRGSMGDVVIRGVFDEVVSPERLTFTFTFVDAGDRPVAPSVFPEWPVGAHIVMTVELHATPRGTRMTVRQHVLEHEVADAPPVLRHRELAGVGWRQTAQRLVLYLEDRCRG